jgi:protocatechuate 3,4-dioxygenase beta subunit
MAISRRKLMQILAGAGAAVVGGGAAGLAWMNHKLNPKTPIDYPLAEGSGTARALPPTPPCDDDHGDPTPAVTEGPFYTPNTPERTNLREAGIVGLPLVVQGRVLTPDCKPIAGAVLDFWSCDGNGVYDNEGFRLRGHQYTDAAGAFRLETVKPAPYKQYGFQRTPHIHVKVQGRNTALLTTQLFFSGEPLNDGDWLVKKSLIMDVEKSAGGSLLARFDFVLA